MEKGTSEYAEDWTSENNLINHFNTWSQYGV